MRGKDLNQRPPGYEPDELPTALPRDIVRLTLDYNIISAGFCQVFFSKSFVEIFLFMSLLSFFVMSPPRVPKNYRFARPLTRLDLSFHFPDLGRVSFQDAASAEIMFCSRDELFGGAAARVEVCGEVVFVGVDCDHDSLVLAFSLKDALFIREQHRPESAVVKRFGRLFNLREPCDEVAELIPFGFVEAGPKSGVPAAFFGLFAPLAAVVNAGYAGHTEREGINQREMAGVIENARDPCHVVIVDKAEHMLALVEGPIFGAELPQKRVNYLEHIHAVEAAEEPLVAFIIRRRVEHSVVDQPVVVSVEHLAEKPEIGLELFGELPKPHQKVFIEAIGDVEPEAVDVELFDP